MLDPAEIANQGPDVHAMQREVDALRKQLMAERTRHLRWRATIERHVGRGCPSESLRVLLKEPEALGDQRDLL